MKKAFVAAILASVAAAVALASAPLQPPDRMPDLTAEQRAALAKGDPVRIADVTQADDGRLVGQGTVYIRVDVPPEEIFNYILDFEHYREFYPNLAGCEVYERDGNIYYVTFELSMLGLVHVTNHFRRVYYPEKQMMTWVLDPRFKNDYRESSGYWKAWPGPDGKTILEYTMYAETDSSMPKAVQKVATGYALKQVSTNMKKRAESGGTYTR